MKKTALIVVVAAALALSAPAVSLVHGWNGAGPLPEDRAFTVPDGANLAMVAGRLQKSGAIYSARAFRFHARVLGGNAAIKAGEFLLPKGASERQILKILSGDEALRRFVTVPEGLPSVMVQDRLMAQASLTGAVETPPEGSLLPDTYDIKAGEPRAAVVARMQAAAAPSVPANGFIFSPSPVMMAPDSRAPARRNCL